MQATGPSQPRIREVWAPNLQEEMRVLRDVIETYPYIAMDTEFPGVVARPIGNFKTSSDYHYQTMRCNVDLLKIIQVGITLSDEEGNYSPEGATWQFNFRFSVDDDMYAPESIDLLQKSGIDFQRHTEYGISPNDFAELMITSGMVLTRDTKWISFHSGYDFGYFVKLLTAESLPVSEDAFFDLLRIWFPTVYDIKFMMRTRNVMKGGLQDLADDLGVQRIGNSHQAGSDSLLTSSLFFRILQVYFGDDFQHEDYNLKLYGFGQTFSSTGGMLLGDAGRIGITVAEREDRTAARELRSQTPAPQNQPVTMGIPLTPGIPSQISATAYGPMGANGPPYLRTSLVGNR
ncbi:CAF1-domain-containing protein [Dendrothele bispora CBS 962.96]|uniref:poly(A)-specific ribonuclease n=1 Tax=Dendrothele bispora (strain CBS 962.96) TaxID=1314807 RepID=A0A4S8MLU2_DENBC|nr:CAF1-domain-containing protein [Dendrothele bispora CBS 962.96]